MLKVSQQPGQPEEILCEGSSTEPPLEMEHTVTAEWPECLKACTKA